MDISLLIYKILDIKGIGKVKANSIFDKIFPVISSGQPEYADLYDILSLHFDIDQVKSILGPQNEEFYELAKNKNVKYLCSHETKFPAGLRRLGTQRPPVISYLGNIDILSQKTVGFCGSRKASDKGLEVAKDITQQVVKCDVTIVSGYASGIDQQTHYWALKEGGNTIIVLPEGINHFKIKAFVKDVWDWNRVLVISEFNPNAIWSAGRAMERNATIIALSTVMVLIEAGETGGSIDAGRKTIEYGKKLFAPVYEGMPIEAKGNQILLGVGALPLKKKRETNRANLEDLISFLKSSTD